MTSEPKNLFKNHTQTAPYREGLYNFFTEPNDNPWTSVDIVPKEGNRGSKATLTGTLTSFEPDFRDESEFRTFRVVSGRYLGSNGRHPSVEDDHPRFLLYCSTSLQHAIVVIDVAFNSIPKQDKKIYMSRIVHEAVVDANRTNPHSDWSIKHVVFSSIVNKEFLLATEARHWDKFGSYDDDDIEAMMRTPLGKPVQRLLITPEYRDHKAWNDKRVDRISMDDPGSHGAWMIMSLN